MIYSPCSMDPGGTLTISRLNDIAGIVCCRKEVHRLPLTILLTGLNHFTLSYYGSYSCIPTLKPNLTALAPRLTNGDLLGLTMSGSHRLYIKHRTGALLPIWIYKEL